MFSRYTHLLTLIAFTVHAVLGCCWHHSHAMGDECCAEHPEVVLQPMVALLGSQAVDAAATTGSPHSCCNHPSGDRHASEPFTSSQHGVALVAAPDHLAPDHPAPDHPAPDHVAPDCAAPDHLAPTVTAAGWGALDQAVRPCHDSHDCDEANCSFAALQMKSLDFEFQVAYGEVPFFDAAALTQQPAHSTDCERHRATRSQFLTSTEHCARLQSWQI